MVVGSNPVAVSLISSFLKRKEIMIAVVTFRVSRSENQILVIERSSGARAPPSLLKKHRPRDIFKGISL